MTGILIEADWSAVQESIITHEAEAREWRVWTRLWRSVFFFSETLPAAKIYSFAHFAILRPISDWVCIMSIGKALKVTFCSSMLTALLSSAVLYFLFQHVFPYPLRFYIPGFLASLRPTIENNGVEWLANETALKNSRAREALESPGAHSKQPNIILILADDLGINDLDTHVGTPNIMSIARNGVRFEKAYSGKICCKCYLLFVGM